VDEEKKQNCAANDGLPQHVRSQGATSPWLTKTPKGDFKWAGEPSSASPQKVLMDSWS